MLENKSIISFTDELASSAPTPGGGGVAALAAALGASLNCMVFNLTVGKKIYEAYDDSIKNLIQTSLNKAEEARKEFLVYIDKDAEVYQKLTNAFKMPKETEQQKSKRNEAVSEGYIAAANIPLELAKRAVNIYELINVACKYGNKNLITDAGAAAIQIHAAIETSVLNIKINLSGIKDDVLRNEMQNETEELLVQSSNRKNEILSTVYSMI